MTRTLIANLGVSGEMKSDKPVPAALTKVEIDGVPPGDVTAMHVDMDASGGLAAEICIHHVRFLDGLEFLSEERHPISNMSLIVEYQEG